jgi:hypothetical protein
MLDAGSSTRREEIMSTLRVLSHLGDAAVSWDVERATAGDPEAAEAVREAERIFAAERARGATAFRVAPGRPAERLDQFDPTADEIVLVPRVSGGCGDRGGA